MIFSMLASRKVHSAFKKYDRVRALSGLTGRDTVVRLLQANGVYDISVGCVSGTLSDHYSPKQGVVNLSDSTYRSNSVAAIAVAAHEVGHVMQKKRGYPMYLVRTALVPVVNFGARFSMLLVIGGILLDSLVQLSVPNLGFYIAMIGVILYGGSFLFALVTLPVELNASRRATSMLLSAGIIQRSELRAARSVLSAAALTYLASLLTSLVYFLRFLFYVLTIFGRRDNHR